MGDDVVPYDRPVSLDLLRKDIDERAEKLRRDCAADKRLARRLALSAVVLSAMTTITLGLPPFSEDASVQLEVTALVLSTSVTVLAATATFLKPDQLWVISARAMVEMYDLRDDLKHAEKTESANQEVLRVFYARYKAILARRNASWSSARREGARGSSGPVQDQLT